MELKRLIAGRAAGCPSVDQVDRSENTRFGVATKGELGVTFRSTATSAAFYVGVALVSAPRLAVVN